MDYNLSKKEGTLNRIGVISRVQLSVDGFEDAFVAAQVGIRECGAARHSVNAPMPQFTGFGQHFTRQQ